MLSLTCFRMFVNSFLTKCNETFNRDAFVASIFVFFFLIIRKPRLVGGVNQSICQSMGSIPFFSRKLFAWLNGLLPKNPLYADRGDGCGPLIMRCFGLSSLLAFSPAGFPHRINTIGLSSLFTTSMIASVNCSQPFPLCI